MEVLLYGIVLNVDGAKIKIEGVTKPYRSRKRMVHENPSNKQDYVAVPRQLNTQNNDIYVQYKRNENRKGSSRFDTLIRLMRPNTTVIAIRNA